MDMDVEADETVRLRPAPYSTSNKELQSKYAIVTNHRAVQDTGQFLTYLYLFNT
ncbi:hypothetical protein EYZ11_001251 [Aspergillus tanneri]|uniref:Uncharacterized protein n=1 Tax=Aspergillus tanneri TaxID=1220188 RepID=A0A4S3JV08_9EURO|nr:hypothetical protein EYZ11_001251 [Aspergillus tanneri]